MADDTNNAPATAGSKTRMKLKILDGLSALAVLMLIVEFWLFSDERFGAVALWLLIIVVLAAQILKMRLRCPHCGGSVYQSWRYSYRSKVPPNCYQCGKPLP